MNSIYSVKKIEIETHLENLHIYEDRRETLPTNEMSNTRWLTSLKCYFYPKNKESTTVNRIISASFAYHIDNDDNAAEFILFTPWNLTLNKGD